MIMTILQTIGIRNILLICACLLSFLGGYQYCSLHYSVEISKYKLEAEKRKNELLQGVDESNKLAREKIASIERNNTTNMEKLKHEYETTISTLRTKYKLTNSMQCNSTRSTDNVSPETADSSKLRCYTENELYRKIERSMAIANECDQLATKYNALLEVCNAQYIQPK